MEQKSIRVGVEVGGTFTDLVAFDEGEIIVTKVRSTPSSPDAGALNAIEASGIALDRVVDLGHGSTIATNAVLERKGARVAFITTSGFRDILLLQRHDRRSIYDLRYKKPEPVVRRRDCFEVSERMGADGRELGELDESAVLDDLIPRLRSGGYDAVAICLLNGYANPAHEERLAKLIRDALPGTLITRSSEVVRDFREFERASTTTLSAYVQPVVQSYLERFETSLQEAGFEGHLSVMQSNGGRLPAAAVGRNAISALFSGPAAGVVGAARQAGRSGFSNLITFDMGGTSTDVCLVEDGRPAVAAETELGGLPVQIPVLDIVTVGGGGGSIAWVDDGGMLRVGPQSAGADPGPACYGFGGQAPTVTDAQVVLGALRPEAFLGGKMRIDAEKSREVLQRLGEVFGLGVEDMAESVLKLVNANIVRAIQLVSTERGRDPRDYVLVPFGGAGPMHAADIADQLGIEQICVPPNAGVISAYGLLASDYLKYASITHKIPLADAATMGVPMFKKLREQLTGEFRDMKLAHEDLEFTYTADMRFVGQAFEVPVAFEAKRLDTLTQADFASAFEEAHQRLFYHGGGAGQAVEIVSFRVGATLPVHDVAALRSPQRQDSARHDQPLFEGGQWVECRHIASNAVGRGNTIEGPAVVEDATATLLIPSGWVAISGDADNLIMTKG
jgi:N-methylhydantoinase A